MNSQFLPDHKNPGKVSPVYNVVEAYAARRVGERPGTGAQRSSDTEE
jgi:hypothetical protein